MEAAIKNRPSPIFNKAYSVDQLLYRAAQQAREDPNRGQQRLRGRGKSQPLTPMSGVPIKANSSQQQRNAQQQRNTQQQMNAQQQINT